MFIACNCKFIGEFNLLSLAESSVVVQEWANYTTTNKSRNFVEKEQFDIFFAIAQAIKFRNEWARMSRVTGQNREDEWNIFSRVYSRSIVLNALWG